MLRSCVVREGPRKGMADPSGVASSGPAWGALFTLACHGSSDRALGPWLGINPSLGVPRPHEGSLTGLLGLGHALRWPDAFCALGLDGPHWAHRSVLPALVLTPLGSDHGTPADQAPKFLAEGMAQPLRPSWGPLSAGGMISPRALPADA